MFKRSSSTRHTPPITASYRSVPHMDFMQPRLSICSEEIHAMQFDTFPCTFPTLPLPYLIACQRTAFIDRTPTDPSDLCLACLLAATGGVLGNGGNGTSGGGPLGGKWNESPRILRAICA